MQRLWRSLGTSPFFLWVTAGLCLGLAFFSPWLWWLGFPGLFAFIAASFITKTYRGVIAGSFLAGCIYMALVLSWLWAIFPLAGLDVKEPFFAFLFIGFGWFSGFVSLAAAKVPAALLLYAAGKKNKRYALVAFPFIWMASEVLGSFLFSAVLAGPGGGFNIDLSFGYVGYLFAEHAFILPLAYAGGVYGLSLLYAGLASAAFCLLASRVPRKKLIFAGAAALLLITAALPLLPKHFDASLSAIAIETNFPIVQDPAEKAAQELVLKQKVTDALSQGYAYIILPEDADLRGQFASDGALFAFLDAYREQDVVLVDSARTPAQNGDAYVRANLYDTKTKSVTRLDKQYLVPGGEYMPALFTATLRLIGAGGYADAFSKNVDYVAGPLSDTASQPAYLPGILFCFESVSPLALYQLAHARPMPFVAHIVSHSWFTRPTLLWHELDQMLRVNARFAHVTVLQAANEYRSLRY